MVEESKFEEELKIPEILPVLPIRNIVIFPYMLAPLMIDREKSIKAIDQALSANRMLLVLAQKDSDEENPVSSELYEIGTVGVVVRMLKLPDQRLKILIQGLMRGKVEQWDESSPFFKAKIKTMAELETRPSTLEQEALVRTVKDAVEKAVDLGKNVPSEITVLVNNLDDPGRLADLLASNLDLKVDVAQDLLSIIDPVERLLKVNEILAREIQVLTVQQQINIQAKTEIDKIQREYLLRQQLKAIQDELGEGSELQEEIKELQGKADQSGMPKEVREEVERHIHRLGRMQPDLAETATLRNYLDLMVTLPWDKATEDNLDLKKAQQILDNDHHGLQKIKERIIEYLAVRKLNNHMKGPILCFVGPPGTGKTSLGRSIARALDRKFTRMSLGGVHDEAEIRGHRRTYVGAMPGRIIQGIHQSGSRNPVFMLDEVDKIGANHRGDPSSALLEVLDPEQNFAFRDNYLSVPFDLSNVLFITTANLLDTIHPAFRDRMEVIHLSGYTEEEKLHIAKKYLIPKQIQAHGLRPEHLSFTDTAILGIITRYTREAGLRNLEREIASVCRKVAKRIAEGYTEHVTVTVRDVHEYLGAERILPDEVMKEDRVGVAVGLAWTPAGGEILFVEALIMKGRGGLILTGQLGEVMRESAQAALSYAKAHAEEFKIRNGFFSSHDIHIHIPEGAIPKDGPSAGVTLAVAMISACTNRSVRRDIAMTGEITLRGHILSIGGIKEKILAARRAKIYRIVLPSLNKRNLEEVPKGLKKNMKFIFVDTIDDVLKHVLI